MIHNMHLLWSKRESAFFTVPFLEIHRFIILKRREKTALFQGFENVVQDFFAVCRDGVVMVTGGHVFQKAGFAGSQIIHEFFNIQA